VIEILEIPFFATEFDHGYEFFREYSFLTENSNSGYRYFSLELSENKHILFYLMEIKDSNANVNLFDRLIPKAPFCFLLLEGETFIVNNFYESYKERYNTPMICLVPQQAKDFDLTYINNVVLEKEANHLIHFDADDPDRHKKILIETLHHILEEEAGE